MEKLFGAMPSEGKSCPGLEESDSPPKACLELYVGSTPGIKVEIHVHPLLFLQAKASLSDSFRALYGLRPVVIGRYKHSFSLRCEASIRFFKQKHKSRSISHDPKYWCVSPPVRSLDYSHI